MNSQQSAQQWVVYQVGIKGQTGGPNAVCDQKEWEAMEKERPGQNRLIRAGIASEGEAERLARGTTGDPTPRNPKLYQDTPYDSDLYQDEHEGETEENANTENHDADEDEDEDEDED